jgi:hypothetical protein
MDNQQGEKSIQEELDDALSFLFGEEYVAPEVWVPKEYCPPYPIVLHSDVDRRIYCVPTDVIINTIAGGADGAYRWHPGIELAWNNDSIAIEPWIAGRPGRLLHRHEWERLRLAIDRLYESKNDCELESIQDSVDIAYKKLLEMIDAYKPCIEQQKKLRNYSGGYIYILQAGQYYKIGRTNDLNQRMTQIQPKLPFETELIHTIETSDPASDESYLHRKFASKRTNGEWFELDEGDIAWLKTL